MKTFRITFESNPESGIYSANLVNAKSAEQATAYFQTLGNYEIVGCTETNEEPKPGQPVHTVPEGWEAPEEEKATRTAEAITERHPNIKKAIADNEAETLGKFNQEIETKTAADILASWYLKQYTTPKTLEAIKNTAPEEKPAADILAKMKAKKAREEAKNTAKRLEALALAESCKLPESVNISVEFTRSRTWGSIPHATITAEQRRTFGTASGCGYDKESAAIASAMNQNPEVMRILYDHAESGEGFPYSVHTFAGLPSFDGGCGVSCFRSVFEACGYEWRQVGNGKTFNAYTITRK